MFSKYIKLKNFSSRKKNLSTNKNLKSLLNNKSDLIKSLGNNYKDNYNFKRIKKLTNKSELIRIIGMGGSILGAQTIYDFLNFKIKKKIIFKNNLSSNIKKNKEKITNLIISKSGNTIETIINSTLLIKKNDKNIFITQKNLNFLNNLAQKLKAEVIEHNNFIGGRYSVLSEVGMLPAQLMGLDVSSFRQLNSLIKNKSYMNSLISNVNSILHYQRNKKYNSIIINYDERSENLFKWYQQLVAESLGKKSIGILPIISNMPKDNHSVMQLYLDGFKNNFFTFFFVNEENSTRLNKKFYGEFNFLNMKNLNQILFNQKKATENIFKKKKIPFRSFEVNLRSEKTLGEIFTFFILETILLGKALNVNPYDQPSVELIKNETKKLLI